MVTTRRAPAPAGASSRANSAPAVPKTPKARKAAPEVPVVAVDNDLHSDSPTKKNKKWKGKHKKQKKPKTVAGSLFNLISRAALLWFTIYTLSICPEDDKLESPVCKGLYHYRRLVLEPYIFPTLERALAHPSVAPYVEAVKPQFHRAIEIATPLALEARTNFNAHVLPQWDKRVVPAWKNQVLPLVNDHIIPQFKQHVVPQWNQYVAPHVGPYLAQAQTALGPYWARAVMEYYTTLIPGAQIAGIRLQELEVQARPYVILAAHKAYEGYVAAQPYAEPVWERFKELFAEVLALLAVQRRQFVDPHVAKIWDRVLELGGSTPVTKAKAATAAIKSTASIISSKAKVSVSSASSAVSSASSAASSSVSSVSSSASSASSSASSKIASKVTSSASQVTESAIEVASDLLPEVRETTSPNPYTTSSVVSEKVAASASSVSSKASSAVSAATETVSSSASSLASKASSVVSAASSAVAGGASSVSSKASSVATEAVKSTHSLKDAAETAAADAEDPVIAAASSMSLKASILAQSASATASSVAAQAKQAVFSDNSDDDDGEDEDFRDLLGISDDLTPIEEAVQEENEAQTPAEGGWKPETEEEKAARAARTVENRKSLMTRHASWEEQLNAQVEASHRDLRKDILDLRKTAAEELKEDTSIRTDMEALEAEAGKLLKGAEKYLKALKKEAKPQEEKALLWEKVFDKVESKLADRIEETEALVNSWYDDLAAKEAVIIATHLDNVQSLADRAQEDLGLDYVWLGDVSYHDWQRFHDLMRTWEKFRDDVNTMVNGTHPESYPNAVQVVIEELEGEVQDIIGGVETRLTRLRRDGLRAFTGDAEAAEAPEVTIPVADPQETEAGAAPVEPVLIGRGKAEVEAALGTVESQEQTEVPPPVKPDSEKSAEEIVGEVVQEAEAEADPLKIVHSEL